MSVGHHRGASSVRGEIDPGPMTAQRRACIGGPETGSRPISEAGHKRGNPLGVKDLRYGVLFYCKVGEGPIDTHRGPPYYSPWVGVTQIGSSAQSCDRGCGDLKRVENAASPASALGAH